MDHRGLEARGETREAEIKLGPAAAALERKGIETDRGNINREIQARNAERQRFQKQEAAALVTEYQTVSAIERQRQEERAEEQQQQRKSTTPERRSLLSAIWSLAKTSGWNMSNVILGADLGELVKGRHVADENRNAERDRRSATEPERQRRQAITAELMQAGEEYRQAQEAKQQSETPPRQFVERSGEQPAPYRAMLQGLGANAPKPEPTTESWIERQGRQQRERDVKQAQDRQRETERRATLTPEQHQAEDDAKHRLRKEVERERSLSRDLDLER